MTNIIDKIFPKPEEALKGIADSIYLINAMGQTFTCESCRKSIEPNEKGDNFYDGEDGTYCSDCQEKAEARFEALRDEGQL